MWGTNKQMFRKLFCIVDNPHSSYPKYSYRPDLLMATKKEIREFASFYTSLNIVRPLITEVFYPLTTTQLQYIKNLTDTLDFPEIDNEHIDLSLAAVNNKIEQIKSGFYITATSVVKTLCSSNKWAYLIRLADELGRKQILIWCRYIYEKKLVCRLFKGAQELDAATLKAFNANELDILVGNPRSAGVGIDISHAQHMIFCTQVHSFIDMEQALLRMSGYNLEVANKTIHVLKSTDALSSKYEHSMTHKRLAHREFFADAPSS